MWRHWAPIVPKMAQNWPKYNKKTMKCLVWSKNWDGYVFWDEKADGDARISKSWGLDSLCDVFEPRMYRIYPKIDQKHNKTRWNNYFDLRISKGTFFVTKKLMAMLEFKNLEKWNFDLPCDVTWFWLYPFTLTNAKPTSALVLGVWERLIQVRLHLNNVQVK